MLGETHPILITSCSSTRFVSPKVKVEDMPSGLTMSQALEWWITKLNEEPAILSPREQYRGMGFMTLAKIQEQFNLDSVKIITGGQGLIDMDEKIVPYDFTASPKEPANVHQKVTAEPFVLPVWWRMINSARDKSATPIAKLVEENPDRYVIIAASKIFLRYAAEDILSIPFEYRNKVRILLAASSIGSVPKQLRPMMIPFDRSFVNDLVGNRNDGNHRAAWKFLELLRDQSFYDMDVLGQQKIIDEMTEPTGSRPQTRTDLADLEEYLKDHPNIMEMNLEDGYRIAQRSLGTIGGRSLFRSVIRKLKGEAFVADATDVTDAADVLKGLGLEFLNGSQHINEEEDALQGIQTFLDALKQVAPKASFAAADVCRWAQAYYPEKKQQTVPPIFESPNKLAYTLKNNVAILGLATDGKKYSLAA